MLTPISLRLDREERDIVAAYASHHRCSQSKAIRELLRLAHQCMDVNGVVISTALHSLDAKLDETAETLHEINGVLDVMEDNFGRVWIETLMGMRLLLDGQNRGLIDRVKEMTTRYLLRLQEK